MKSNTLQKVYVIIAFFLVFCATSFSGCISDGEVMSTNETVYTWMDAEMTNVVTEEIFTLRELTQDGTPVVLHIFAAWCPACNMQLGESTTFLSDYPGKAHIVAFDIDVSESPAAIAEHVASRKYAGIFTTAEQPIVQGLVNLFGQEIMMTIPQTVLISGENLVYLGPGVFGSDKIATRIDAMYQQFGK